MPARRSSVPKPALGSPSATGQYKSYRRRTDGAAWRETLREVFLG